MSIYHKIVKNWKSGLTVAFVSIPLSVSLAVASQASPAVGIITAIWAGFVASLFGGSNYNIIGPTGALSGVLAMHAIMHGASTLPSVAIISGFIILLTYLLRLEKFLYFVSATTVHGFTLGVACIIILNQINNVLGLVNVPIHQHLVDNIIESCQHLSDFSMPAVILFALFLAMLFLITKYISSIPNIILLSPIGIGIGYLSSQEIIPWQLQTLQSKFSTITSTLFIPLQFTWSYSIFTTSCVVAFISLLETMISARIADGITKTKHDKRKEILGLGFANIVSGCMGGMPATAALARTALNIKFGASDATSAMLSSLFIMIISTFLITLFEYMPLAVIAAILVYIAVRMVDIDHLVRLYNFETTSFLISMIVAFVTICQDPTAGILCGILLSSLILLHTLAQGQFEITHDDQLYQNNGLIDQSTGSIIPSDVLLYVFKSELTFINSQAHITRFEADLMQYKVIILHLEQVSFIDFDGIEAFDTIIDLVESSHKKIFITGVNLLIQPMLKHSHYFASLKEKGYVFQTNKQALDFLHI